MVSKIRWREFLYLRAMKVNCRDEMYQYYSDCFSYNGKMCFFKYNDAANEIRDFSKEIREMVN